MAEIIEFQQKDKLFGMISMIQLAMQLKSKMSNTKKLKLMRQSTSLITYPLSKKEDLKKISKGAYQTI